jgi:membrane protease YdiL (CAAX protease family)
MSGDGVIHKLLHDKWFGAAVLAALGFWLGLILIFQVAPQPGVLWQQPSKYLMLLLVLPVLEEVVFRGLVQDMLQRWVRQRRVLSLSYANLLTSVGFVLAHLPFHPLLWTLAVFVPSLIFGFFKDRYNSLLPPVLLHVFYNIGYFLLYP